MGLWCGRIRVRAFKDGKRVLIGCYKNFEDALEAYRNFYKKYPRKTDEEKSLEQTYIKITDKRKPGASGYRGVRFHRKDGHWEAGITLRRQHYYLGYYKFLQDAINARKEAEEHLFGDFIKWYEARKKEQDLAEPVMKAEE